MAFTSWQVPLCEAWGPRHATTVLERDMAWGADLMALFERRAAYAQVLLRGRPRAPDDVSTLLSHAARLVVEAEAPVEQLGGTFLLKLGEAGGARTLTVRGVTFP